MENETRSHINKSGKKGAARLASLILATALVSTLFILAPVATATQSFYPMTIQAAGGTFVNPVMQVWTTSYYVYTGSTVSINYQAIGSGAGQTDIENNLVAFAGSDAPLTAAQAAPYEATYGPLLQFPETLGGVAIFYNIPGVTVNLDLTGDIVARIYTQNITMWNDPAIQALNPSVTLPDQAIIPVHRSDGSGTTYALTNYFEKVSSNWNASWTNGVISTSGCPCFATSIAWPAGELGAKGSAGVAADVEGNPYSIGYADSYYAFSNSLKAAAIENQAGRFLVPNLADIAAAANAFSTQVQNNPTFTITNAPGANSYPISTYTYLLVWQDQTNYQQGYDVAYFFLWVVNQGQAYGPVMDYPKLPSSVVAIDESIIEKLQYSGTPIISVAPTTVTCKSPSVVVGKSVKCTIAVGGTDPKGTATWSSTGFGLFAPATCQTGRKGSCSVTYFPTYAQSMVNISASFISRDSTTIGSGVYSYLTVAPATSKTTIICSPSSIKAVGDSVTCRAIVKGYSPTGTITWSQPAGTGSVSFSSSTCTLAAGTCSVTVTGTAKGPTTISAAYGADNNNLASSTTKKLTVK
jgi:phosphate ABC transporter phosphate-binding protein